VHLKFGNSVLTATPIVSAYGKKEKNDPQYNQNLKKVEKIKFAIIY